MVGKWIQFDNEYFGKVVGVKGPTEVVINKIEEDEDGNDKVIETLSVEIEETFSMHSNYSFKDGQGYGMVDVEKAPVSMEEKAKVGQLKKPLTIKLG